MDEYLTLNRANWDERAPAHAASPDYDLARFLNDPTAISDVVAFDVPRLGDVTGLRGVHLQCHIGTDTLSLARLGAEVTGLDFSPPALAQARALAARTGADIRYVESELYRALDVLDASSFDLVYTGVGALCWLPSIVRWAEIVASLLTPGGRLFIRDGHPMLATTEVEAGQVVLRYPYFEQTDPMVWTDAGTYVETNREFEMTTTHEWSHGLGEMITALLGAGMDITALDEHDSAPWQAPPGVMRVDDGGEWRLSERPERLAATFTLQARRR